MKRWTVAQKNIIQALGEDTLTAEELAVKAGYELSGHFKKALASLRKQGVLGNNQPGYYVMPDYKQMLPKPDR